MKKESLKENPKLLFFSFMAKTAKLWPVSLYVKCLYWVHIGGGRLPLRTPKTFNQKMNWSKVYDRNPLYTRLADKYQVKDYVRQLLGDDAVVPNYGVWNDFDEIDFNTLPKRFVLKCTHDSSGAILCRDKDNFDFVSAKKKIERSMKINYYWTLREWPYKNIEPRIIADELLDEHTGHELHDYKFWCFDGVPKVMYITNKGKKVYENFYDMNFEPLDIDHGFERIVPEYPKPRGFEKMKEYAAKLSKGIPFVRIDFFEVNGHVYFGEFTFYDWGGMKPFKDGKWDDEIGSWINLKK